VPDPDLSKLDLFYHDVTPSRASVYARLPAPQAAGCWELAGRVRGPFTTRGHTLPSNASLQDLGRTAPGSSGGASGQSPSLLARAMVLDPCTWSPEAPNLYDVTVELRREGQTVATTQRKLGLRDLRPQKQGLYLDGKRFVVRGVHGDGLTADIAAWWEEAAVRITQHYDPAALHQASAAGVMTVLRLDAGAAVDVRLLRQVAQHAAVAVAVLPGEAQLPENVRSLVPNLLLAQRLSGTEPVAAWTQVVWLENARLPEGLTGFQAPSLPVFAVRPERFDSLARARAACDVLQADLAPYGQFAGYIV
jgi:hypothetical protein